MKLFCEKNLKNLIRELGYTNATFDSRVEDVCLLVPHRGWPWLSTERSQENSWPAQKR